MGYSPGGDDDDPFLTLFDIAAISMVCAAIPGPRDRMDANGAKRQSVGTYRKQGRIAVPVVRSLAVGRRQCLRRPTRRNPIFAGYLRRPGIAVVCVVLCIPLILLGSMLIGFPELAVLIVLFYGAYYFAVRGSQ